MYITYFKLTEAPFSLTPDPRYLFMSERHREGLAHLLYGVQQSGGFVQLTGEIGSGKTTLCRCLIRQLPPDTDVALILNPRLTVIELLATVCDELRIPYPRETGSIKVLIDALNQRLLETHAQGRRTVLIIDEAQNLTSEVLEQIRLLTNLETAQEKLLQIILIGQPELLALLKGKKLRQLAQRITARYHLLPLSRSETFAYIQHRLRVAGRSDPLFTAQGMRCVYRLSRGMPRVINIICDRALLGAYAMDKRRVGAAIVRRASRETQGRAAGALPGILVWTLGIVVAALVTAGAILYVREGRSPVSGNRAAVSATAPIHTQAEKRANPGAVDPEKTAVAGAASIAAGVRSSADGPAPVPQKETKPRLADILADPSKRGDAASVFASLYSAWGIAPSADKSDLSCSAAGVHVLECLFQIGNWLKLRRYDLPAILELVLPSGQRCRAAVIRLDNETATLVIGGRPYAFPLLEIDQVWDGSFILVWKPPFALRNLSQGMRGREVAWVRQALDRLEGKESNPPVSDLFDSDLQRRVKTFQRAQSLIPDGYVGSETLVRLTLALEGGKAPSISRRSL